MPGEEGYEVLRFVEQGENCHVIMDVKAGQIFSQWMKRHPIMEKEELFQWFRELMGQLDLLHHSKGNPCYQYLTPFSIVLTQEKKILLLDFSAEENTPMIKQLQRRSIRCGFFLEGKEMKPVESIQADIYSLGKTIQYVFSQTDVNPPLTKGEELRIKAIISKCLGEDSKHSYKQIKDILKQFPKKKHSYSFPKNNFKKTIPIIIAILVISILGIVAIFKVRFPQSMPNRIREEEKKIPPIRDTNSRNPDGALYRELGFLYFLEMEDYEKSRRCFLNITGDDPLAKCYQSLSVYMLGGGEKSDEEIEEILQKGEKNIPDTQDVRYYQGLARVYSVIETESAKEHLIRLSEYCFTLSNWQEKDKEKKIEKELREYLAQGYVKLDQKEKAIQQYLALTQMEKVPDARKDYYLKLTQLLQETGKQQEAISNCLEGIEQVKETKELRVLYLKMRCKDATMDRAVCAQEVQKQIKECPDIKEDSEFQKLQQEYEIKVEGENVWVGK
ncbi:MAG: hypothetical protein RR621_09235 [Lachnospiraceae bacterium]